MIWGQVSLVWRRHRGSGFNEVISAYQRDVADLDNDGSTTDYVSLQPLYDGAFDCVGVLDHTGAVAESYAHTYDGTVSITNGAGQPLTTSAVGWHQSYGRMYRDAESGLLYSVHRYYSPATGRFVTEDPLGRWFDSSGHGNGYSWAGSSYRNGWDPLGLEVSSNVSGIVAVMRQAASEAAAVDAVLGGSENTPEAVTNFMNDVNADDIDWEGKALPSGDLADTTPKGKKRRNFRVRLNVIKIRRTGNFADTIAHEMEHVHRFRCGEPSPHHNTDKKRRAYDARGKKVGDYLRVRSKTLRLFEAWLEHTKRENGAVDVVARAAANALAGKAPPGRK